MKPNQRQSVRKALQSTGVLSMEGVPFNATTIDVSTGGISLIINRQLPASKRCHLNVEVPVNGVTQTVAAMTEIVYCFYIGQNRYRLGLQLLELYADGTQVLAEYLHN